jgi:hypothetical protein
MSTGTAWGETVLTWKQPLSIMLTATIPKDTRKHWTDNGYKYTYWSGYRPLSFWFKLPGTETFSTATTGLVVSKELLSLDDIAKYELQPFGQQTMGLYILELAKALKLHVELVKELGTEYRVALLFKNPRGKWQLSHFDATGPTGHEESDDPAELAYDAYVQGYRRFGRGLLDDMALEFDDTYLRRISLKQKQSLAGFALKQLQKRG